MHALAYWLLITVCKLFASLAIWKWRKLLLLVYKYCLIIIKSGLHIIAYNSMIQKYSLDWSIGWSNRRLCCSFFSLERSFLQGLRCMTFILDAPNSVISSLFLCTSKTGSLVFWSCRWGMRLTLPLRTFIQSLQSSEEINNCMNL